MKTQKQIKDKIREIENDKRYKYPTATIVENAPLALVQLEMESFIGILKWVLREQP